MKKKYIFLIVVLIIVVLGVIFFTNQPLSCQIQYHEIENEMDKANYCQVDSDCDVIMLGGWYIDFGCYHFINKNVDKEQFYNKMDVYKLKCSQIINDCAPAPEATCVAGKCVYLEKE